MAMPARYKRRCPNRETNSQANRSCNLNTLYWLEAPVSVGDTAWTSKASRLAIASEAPLQFVYTDCHKRNCITIFR